VNSLLVQKGATVVRPGREKKKRLESFGRRGSLRSGKRKGKPFHDSAAGAKKRGKPSQKEKKRAKERSLKGRSTANTPFPEGRERN